MNAAQHSAQGPTSMTGNDGILLHVASWNVNSQARYAVEAHLNFLLSKGCDIVALQEVKEDYFATLQRHPAVADVAFSLDIRPPEMDAPRKHRLGCAILTLNRCHGIQRAAVIDTTICPERTIVAEIVVDGHCLQVASFHCPNGSKWERRKGKWLHEVAGWANDQTVPTVFGIDANTPKREGLVDTNPAKWWREDTHPEVGNGAQQLVGDLPRHGLRDVWKRLYPDATEYPVSHNRDKVRPKRPQFECRYDFIFASPTITSILCEYHYEETVKASSRLSDHALVTATVKL